MNKDEQKKHYKSLQICWKWWTKQQNSGQELIDIPIEVFNRGSEAIDIYFNEIEKSQNSIYRSRICVVGPSGWGKTSLVKSLISGVPEQVPEDIRTIGIDQFQWNFNVVKRGMNLMKLRIQSSTNTIFQSLIGLFRTRIKPILLNRMIQNTENHQVSFWDFAGQDVYKGAHSIFFSSSRTLFLICVNLQAYDEDIKNNRNTASDEILRWIRLVFAKQPHAKLLFVGTKADLVDENVIQDIKEDLSDCVRDWCDKYSNDIKNRQSLLSNNDTPQHELQHLQMQLSALTNVKDAVNGKWVITSSKDENILKAACDDIQCHIRDNNVGFIMPESYIAVLNYLYQLRNDARSNMT